MKLNDLSYSDVVAYMEKSTSVSDWNSRREEMKSVTHYQNIHDLDASGLITKVLTKK